MPCRGNERIERMSNTHRTLPSYHAVPNCANRTLRWRRRLRLLSRGLRRRNRPVAPTASAASAWCSMARTTQGTSASSEAKVWLARVSTMAGLTASTQPHRWRRVPPSATKSANACRSTGARRKPVAISKWGTRTAPPFRPSTAGNGHTMRTKRSATMPCVVCFLTVAHARQHQPALQLPL